MSEDPIGFSGGDSSLYRYVSNKPLILNDPSGKVSPASALACGLMLIAGEAYDVYNDLNAQLEMQDKFDEKWNALTEEAKTCPVKRKVDIMKEKDKMLKEFPRKSALNIVGALTPSAGVATATAACIIAVSVF